MNNMLKHRSSQIEKSQIMWLIIIKKQLLNYAFLKAILLGNYHVSPKVSIFLMLF